ncbi:MAG: ATP-binding cassette domain-containing protein [Clostridiaceae bacterium]|nr:ATP-binding cassette domain-containing protein [Clostridiaceae bacterium]
MNSQKKTLLKVENLKKYYPIKGGVLSRVVGHVKAVDDVSFHILEGETLGLVGESGCGKTTTGKTVLRLTEQTEGAVIYQGENIFDFTSKQMREYRKDVQIIFQDPYGSLNPRQTVGDMLREIIRYHKLASGEEMEKKIVQLMEMVGLSSYHIGRYPHEFSGGQRQRVGIARALCLEPKMIVCDEPVSALDVSIQSQILNLLKDLQRKLDLTYLFIAHDLSVVKHISDRVGVMYLGKIAELAETDSLYENPLHPYTKALLKAIPVADVDYVASKAVLKGDVPSPSNPPPGCVFHTRCSECMDICSQKAPVMTEARPGHFVSCHLYE